MTLKSVPLTGNNPKLAVIGGRLEDDNDAIYAEMHRLSGGRIVVFPTASSEPDVVGAETVAVFRNHGFDVALAAIHGEGAAVAAQDPAIVALVEDYGNVFFTGGDQALITSALAPQGVESQVLAAIRRVHAAGGMVAGSSAGAAIMSGIMIEGGTSLEAATYGVVTDPDMPGLLLRHGLGFFPWGIVDQHFIKRGRFGRLVVAMAASGVRRGFGIDENTALFVDGAKGHVIGELGAFVLDMKGAKQDKRRHSIDNITFSYADDGDSIDLANGRIVPGPEKRPVGSRDIAYRAATVEQIEAEGAGPFDVVLTMEVIEHVADPAVQDGGVGRLQRHIGAAAHRNADGGSLHCRGIVYPVPDHRQRGMTVQLGYRADFIRRQQSGFKLQPQLTGNCRRRARIIAGQDHALYAKLMQRRHGLFGVIAQGVAQRQHPFRDAVLHNGHDGLSGLF